MINIKALLKYFTLMLILVLSFGIGYLSGQSQYAGKGYFKPRAEDGFRYLGVAGDREIYMLSFVTKDESERKNFALKINDDYVYWESDRNSDGKIDNIKHFEKGILVYESEDSKFDGVLNRRMVESYKQDGSHDICMVDLNADNEFDLRIKNPDMDDAIVEIFVGNKWTKRVKKNDIHGIYDAEGNFLPVKFRSGKWEIIESEERIRE